MKETDKNRFTVPLPISSSYKKGTQTKRQMMALTKTKTTLNPKMAKTTTTATTATRRAPELSRKAEPSHTMSKRTQPRQLRHTDRGFAAPRLTTSSHPDEDNDADNFRRRRRPAASRGNRGRDSGAGMTMEALMTAPMATTTLPSRGADFALGGRNEEGDFEGAERRRRRIEEEDGVEEELMIDGEDEDGDEFVKDEYFGIDRRDEEDYYGHYPDRVPDYHPSSFYRPRQRDLVEKRFEAVALRVNDEFESVPAQSKPNSSSSSRLRRRRGKVAEAAAVAVATAAVPEKEGRRGEKMVQLGTKRMKESDGRPNENRMIIYRMIICFFKTKDDLMFVIKNIG